MWNSISIRQGSAGKGKPGVEVFPEREEPRIQYFVALTESKEGEAMEAIVVFILVYRQGNAAVGVVVHTSKANKTVEVQRTLCRVKKMKSKKWSQGLCTS